MTADITVYAIRCDGELVTTERASIAKAWKEGGIEVIELSTTARHLEELNAADITICNREARIAELEALLKFADERINKMVDEQAAKAAPQQKGEWSREVVQGYLVIRSPLGDSYEFPLSMLADHFAQEAPRAVHPFGYVNTYTGQFFKDVEPCRQNNEGHWRTVYEHPAQLAAPKDGVKC